MSQKESSEAIAEPRTSGADTGRVWHPRPNAELAPAWAELAHELRETLDVIAASAPPPEATDAARGLVTALRETCAPFVTDEAGQLFGQLIDVPGRGQTLCPPYTVATCSEDRITTTVEFGRYHLGSNGAVHGGSIALLFDELLGFLAITGRAVSRTAYLHVDYRSVTPIERELTVRGWFERIEARKRFLRGTLHDGDRLCAEAEGLFVELRHDQP